MNYSEFFKSMFMTFAGSIAITIMFWFFLAISQIDYIQYLGALLGMYVFAAFGVNRVVEDNIVPNNYLRFILAILCIVVFSVAFLYIMPMVFGANVFPDPLSLNFGNFNLVLDNNVILTIFGLIVLVANYFDYK